MSDPSRIALVTGASSGIGRDIALRLIAEGYIVVGGARRLERLHDLVQAGGEAVFLDLNDDASLQAAVAHVLAERGRIDVLVNAAGYGQYGALEEVPLAEARRQFEANLFGTARLIQLCLPAMRAAGKGRIVNVSSVGGRFALPLGGWYHASKFALEGYSDSLRNEVRQFGIDVVVIEPGGIESEWAPIAIEEANRHSGSGPYARMVARYGASVTRLKAPPPRVVSDMVVRALSARRPATRYSGGLMAKPLLLLRRLLSDRMFDRLISAPFT